MNTPENKNSKDKYVSQETLAEIRNALAIISGFAQLQILKPELNELLNHKRQLQDIIDQVERINRLLPG